VNRAKNKFRCKLKIKAFKIVLIKVEWALRPCPLIKSPLYLPSLFLFEVSGEKLVTLHNFTKMTSLYYNLARKFEISPTFLIYFE
jgi:hypothetical protein